MILTVWQKQTKLTLITSGNKEEIQCRRRTESAAGVLAQEIRSGRSRKSEPERGKVAGGSRRIKIVLRLPVRGGSRRKCISGIESEEVRR